MTVPTLASDKRIQSQTTVVESGYTPELACLEAGRCLDCGINTIFDSDKGILCGGCADICPELCLRLASVTELVRDEQLGALLDVRYEPNELEDSSAIIKDESRCIRCGLCALRCPTEAMTMERFNFVETEE